MSKRHDAIGIKQVVRLEWMHKAAQFLMSGMDSKTVRKELHEFLDERKGNGTEGERGETSRTQVVNMLMRIWVTPDPELVPFRDALLNYLREHPSQSPSIHWSMISAVYPFWFSVAKQVGRLLGLQDQVAQSQIFNRMKEQYGDRETVSRYARYVVRSFVFWNILEDADTKGCYKKASVISISDPDLAALMLESALLAIPEAKATVGLLTNNPAFFPFQLPLITGDYLAQNSSRIDALRYGLDEEFLKLKDI